MLALRKSPILRTIPLLIAVCILSFPAHAKYSGGTGEPNDPYQIATAADLIALGETPADYDKHFILTADIDLDPNLPGGKVFDKAVIAPNWDACFAGVFDGKGHTISHLTIRGASYLGLFGILAAGAEAKNLNHVHVDISGSGDGVGGLVGHNDGNIIRSAGTGVVNGRYYVGGLAGQNNGSIATSYSAGTVGATGSYAGGLVGQNGGRITTSYSSSAVSGNWHIGGLAGQNYGSVTTSYSIGRVSGNRYLGGLVGFSDGDVLHSVWDSETSRQLGSAGGVGLTRGEMMDPYMLGLNGFGEDPNWVLDIRRDYPRLAWEGTAGQAVPEPIIDWLAGSGTPDAPYRINTADQLILLGRASILWDEDFVLAADIDLDPALPGRRRFEQALIQTFTGIFDGNNYTISHLTITGGSYLGLFGRLKHGAEVKNLRVSNVEVSGNGYGGGLVGLNNGHVSGCCTSGMVKGTGWEVGGLVGCNRDGRIATSYSAATVSGDDFVGGLVGNNADGTISTSYSTGPVSGAGIVGGLSGYNSGRITTSYSISLVRGTDWDVGGLVGNNFGRITTCYSTGAVSGTDYVGGLVGHNGDTVAQCYSAGMVHGTRSVGGLIGYDGSYGPVTGAFWDTQTSGQTESAGGTGKTTAEMQDINTYINAGWDFSNEILNGTCDYWQMSPGGYPHLGYRIGAYPIMPEGKGTAEQPYRIRNARDLGTVWFEPRAHYRLETSVDISGMTWSIAVVPSFDGTFDGNGYAVKNLHVRGTEYVGLFGELDSEASVCNLGVQDMNVAGSGRYVGGVAGYSSGLVTNSYTTGTVSGGSDVGGLLGVNVYGSPVNRCYSMCTVTGDSMVGGLVGWGAATDCYSTGAVSGTSDVGGLLGVGAATRCYSTGAVTGTVSVGGLASQTDGKVLHCVWDKETSGLSGSAGGVGLTTAEMMDLYMLGLNGFANDPNWVLYAGHDYPRLAWQNTSGQIIPQPVIDWLEGHGTAEDPYRIGGADQLVSLGRASIICDKSFVLTASIDLDPTLPTRCVFHNAMIPVFMGVLDGNGHTISHLTIQGGSYLGLFGQLASGAEIKNLGIVDMNVAGSGSVIGGLAGLSLGNVTMCYSDGVASGNYDVGGLVGCNGIFGHISNCFSTGAVRGTDDVGGLVGINSRSGGRGSAGCISNCYSADVVISDGEDVGGLVGNNEDIASMGIVIHCFWDTQVSGRTWDSGGTGKTTAEMQMAKTFIDAGWDFVGETTNGTEDIWWILEGKDYPRLWWELIPQN